MTEEALPNLVRIALPDGFKLQVGPLGITKGAFWIYQKAPLFFAFFLGILFWAY
jgi:hypothetical protein